MGIEVLGVGLLTLVLGVLGGGFLALRLFAPRTETQWDDRLVDVVEGVANHLELDPDELAKKSYGKLKKAVVFETVKRKVT